MKQRRRRHLRVLPDHGGYYVHVTSRVRGQDFLFGPEEKGMFVKLMQKWAVFSGVGVVTHCVMSNHFHILLYIPVAKELLYDDVVGRLSGIWSEEKVAEWKEGYALIRDEEEQLAYLRQVTGRMYQLPEFMRALKQCFSRWYNCRHGARGTLWEDRYRSVVVEPTGVALLAVSAYIDLNPIRARICEDPAAYAWSGYGAGVGGVEMAQDGLKHLILHRVHGVMPYGARRAISRKRVEQEGLPWWEVQNEAEKARQQVLSRASWDDVVKIYRCWLYKKGVKGDEGASSSARKRKRDGFTREEMEKVYAAGGTVPLHDWLSEKQPFLSLGTAYGGADFLYYLYVNFREAFGPGRVSAGLNFQGEGVGLQVLHRSYGRRSKGEVGDPTRDTSEDA